MEPWGKPGPPASSPPPRRTAAAASPCSAAASTACCGPRRSSPAAPSASRRRAAARRHRVVRPRPARPGDQGGAARRLERSRVRRRPGRGDPRRHAGQRARRAREPAGPPARVRRGRRPLVRPRGQLDRALPTEPDVAVILIGVNDVTHRVLPPSRCAPRRGASAGCGARRGGARRHLPDLGTIKPIAPPLKQVARAWSRRLATAQTIAVVEAGGRTVSLGSILGPEFAAAPALLFGPDRFHPSADGYRSLAEVLLPSTLAALGLIRDDEAQPEASAARACCRSPPRRCRPSTPRAPSSTAPRSAAPAAAYAACGWSCGTAAASRSPRPRRR